MNRIGFIGIVALGCGNGDTPGEKGKAPDVTDPQTETNGLFASLVEVRDNPNPQSPLVKVLTVETLVPTRIDVNLTEDGETRSIAFDALASAHEVDLLALHAGTGFTVDVTATAEDGTVGTSAPVDFSTDPLPADFPVINVLVSDPARMEPGYTLLGEVGTDLEDLSKYIIIVDERGEVVWYWDADVPGGTELEFTERGTIITAVRDEVAYDDTHLLEIDMRGDVVREYAGAYANPRAGAIVIDVPVLHHDVGDAPDGGLFALGWERLSHPAYPTSETDPLAPTAPAELAVDMAVELAPDGTVLETWSFADLLDPNRIGRDSVEGRHWAGIYPDLKDWTHANSLAYIEEQDAFIASSRHQDAVFQFSRQTGELDWLMAPATGWSPEFDSVLLTAANAETRQFYHQHAPELTPDGNILLFDNGNFRASAYEPEVPNFANVSRAIEYQIDPVAGTFEEVWSYGDQRDPTLFCSRVGDADMLDETGNVLVTFGIHYRGQDPLWTIVEVTHTDPPEVVFELESGVGRLPLSMYRAERIRSLYP